MEPNNPFALLELDFIKKKTTPISFSIFKIISHQPYYSIHLQYKYKHTYPIEKVEDIIFKWLRESKGNLRQGVHVGVLYTMGVGSGKEQWIEGQEGTIQSKWIWVIFFLLSHTLTSLVAFDHKHTNLSLWAPQLLSIPLWEIWVNSTAVILDQYQW